jgi:hypothetical protein
LPTMPSPEALGNGEGETLQQAKLP